MPQTITLQRGEVTISNNTSTVLFTNGSSGTATRLVVGYLGYTSDFATVYGYCTFAVLRNGATSPNFNIIAATYPSDPARTVSFSPHDTANAWHGQATSTFEYSPVFRNSTAGIVGASCLSASGNGPTRAFYNPNVMIGPSDVVYCGWSDNGGGNRAAVVQYCFTLITES